MDLSTQRALAEHNRRFYDAHATAFSATREDPWPGWPRVIAGLRPSGRLRVLDVGCGNARLASWLRDARAPDGEIHYTGVDACAALLAAARERCPDATLHRADLVDQPLDRALPAGEGPARNDGNRSLERGGFDPAGLERGGFDPAGLERGGFDPAGLERGGFDLVCAFGLLHHIPGFARRRALVHALAERVAPGGRLALAFWRFGEHERFAHRRLDWSAAPTIDAARLEPGDHLLAWGDPGRGAARYCHASDDREIAALLEGIALGVRDDFASDGRSGDLNRYLVLERG